MKSFLSVLLLLYATVSGFGLSEGWKEFHMRLDQSVWADSSLTERIGGKEVTYGPDALFDSDYSTPWVEGVEGSGAGEGVTILTRRMISGLSLVNGYALSERLFLRNNRLKKFSITFIAGMTAPGLVSEDDYYFYFIREHKLSAMFQVEDIMDTQHISLYYTEAVQSRFYRDTVRLFAKDYPELFTMILNDLGIDYSDEISGTTLNQIMEVYGFFALRVTIQDVYCGTVYNDTCISEIGLELEEFIF